MKKFCTKSRPADCLPTQIWWAIGYSKYSHGGFLLTLMVVVAVVFIKTAIYVRGRVLLILEGTFARVIIIDLIPPLKGSF